MKFSYDPQHNIAYIQFQKKSSEIESLKISDELIVDLAPDGTVYGIELLNANVQIGRDDARIFLIVNEATGQEVDVPIAFYPS